MTYLTHQESTLSEVLEAARRAARK